MRINNIIGFVLDTLGVFMTIFSCYFSYILINKLTIKINFKAVALFLIFMFFIFLNGSYNYTISKILVSLSLLILFNSLCFKVLDFNLVLDTIYYYLVSVAFEIIMTTPLIFVKYDNIFYLDNSHMFKTLFTYLVFLNAILFIALTKKYYIKIRKKLYNKKIPIFLIIILTFVILALITYKTIFNFSYKNYLINIVTLFLVSIFFIIVIYQNLKVRQFEEKEMILLEFMSEYEKIIDKDRVNRHEMLNNLLILKSLANKDDLNLVKVLNDLIQEYDVNTNNILINLYKLPPGLKGLIYYKVNTLSNSSGINIHISSTAVEKINLLDLKLYRIIYKIVGILLDNSIEECKEIKTPYFLLDIYMDKNNIVIYIENNKRKKVSLSKIYKKGFSTKGKNRGLGLYLINKIIKKSKVLNLEQKIEKHKFISVLTIKNH